MKVTVAEMKKKTKQKTNKQEQWFYLLTLPYFSVSQQYWTQKLLRTANINIFSFKSE